MSRIRENESNWIFKYESNQERWVELYQKRDTYLNNPIQMLLWCLLLYGSHRDSFSRSNGSGLDNPYSNIIRIATTRTTITLLLGEVGVYWTNTASTTTSINTKLRTTSITNCIISTEWLNHRGWCAMILICTKTPNIPTCEKMKFLVGEVGGPRINTTSTITSSNK